MLRILNIITVILFITTSCEKSSVGDCFKSTGPITVIDRPVSGFHTVVLKDNIDLEIVHQILIAFLSKQGRIY